MSRIAITVQRGGEGLDTAIDERFGGLERM